MSKTLWGLCVLASLGLASGIANAQAIWVLQKGKVQLTAIAERHVMLSNDLPNYKPMDAAFKSASVLVTEHADEKDFTLPYGVDAWDGWIAWAGRVYPLQHGDQAQSWHELIETLTRLEVSPSKIASAKRFPVTAIVRSISEEAIAKAYESALQSEPQLRALGTSLPGVDRHYLELARARGMRIVRIEHGAAHEMLTATDCGEKSTVATYLKSANRYLRDLDGRSVVKAMRSDTYSSYESTLAHANEAYQHPWVQVEHECGLVPRNYLWARKIDHEFGRSVAAEKVFMVFGAWHALPLPMGHAFAYRRCGHDDRFSSFREFGNSYRQAICANTHPRDFLSHLVSLGWKVTQAPKGWPTLTVNMPR